jgi:hypothetical protein
MDRKYVFYWKLGKLFNVMYENLKLEAFWWWPWFCSLEVV